MTPFHKTLQDCFGYTDCRTVGDKTAALHSALNGTVLHAGIEVKGDAVTWETPTTFYGRRQVEEAKSALEAWAREQEKAAVSGNSTKGKS